MQPKKRYLLAGTIVPPKGAGRRVDVYSHIHAYSQKQARFLLLTLHKAPVGSTFQGTITFERMVPPKIESMAKSHKPRRSQQVEGQISLF